MGAPYNLIPDKAEQAIQAVIRAAGTGIPNDQVFASFAQGTETIGPNHVRIEAQPGIERPQNSGVYRLSVVIQVQSNLDVDDETAPGTNPVTTHRDLAAKVFDALFTTTLAQDLSDAIDDFYVFPSVERRLGRQRVENRKAVSEILLEFTAAPSDIT